MKRKPGPLSSIIVGKINQLLEIFQGTVQQKLQSTRYNDTVQA